MTVIFLTSASSSPFNRPFDWTTSGHTVELVGCGGAGGLGSTGGATNRPGGGGGGGGYLSLSGAITGSVGTTVTFAVKASNATTGNNDTNATFWEGTTTTNSYEGACGAAGGAGVAGTSAGGAGTGGANATNGSPAFTYATLTSGAAGTAGNGGAGTNNPSIGAGGGGGAAGPTGAGKNGGSPTGAGAGGGGGSNAGTSSAGGNGSGATGGNGGNGTGGSGGGTTGTTTGQSGSTGGGGRGSDGTTVSGTSLTGGNGGTLGNVSAWTQTTGGTTAGVGGGGGGAGDNSVNAAAVFQGGNGANYGGGGGGTGGQRGTPTTNTAGTGGGGLIVITYTSNPISVGTLTLTTNTPSVNNSPHLLTITPTVGTLTLTRGTPQILTIITIKPGVGTLALTSNAPTIWRVTYQGPGDVVSGASAYWAVRAYTRAVTSTSCIRLRRNGDNVYQDFQTLPDGTLDTASIITWAGGNFVYVSRLYDQTGNGNDLIQPVWALQPGLINIGASIRGADILAMTPRYMYVPSFPAVASPISSISTQRDSIVYTGPGDIVAGATAFWGLRAYSSATIGANAVRLREDNGNTEQDFATIAGGGLPLTSIDNFRTTNGAHPSASLFITKLYDQTGNGYHWEQTSAAIQPTFTLSAIGPLPSPSFTHTTQQRMQTVVGAGTPTNTAPITTLLVAKPNLRAVVINGALGLFGGNVGGTWASDIVLSDGTVRVLAEAVVQIGRSTGVLNTDTLVAISCSYDATNWAIYANGVSIGSGVNAQTLAQATVMSLADQIGLTVEFDGLIPEMMQYNSVLTLLQSANISANQHNYWGF